jgi:hypothetical protein
MPGVGQYLDPALNTTASPVVGPPSSLEATRMPPISDNVKGVVFVSVLVAYVLRILDNRDVRRWHCREAAIALGIGCLMNIAQPTFNSMQAN